MVEDVTYTCPVCGYDDLEDQPADYEICPSCGTEFGYHDATRSHLELRQQWLERGARWHSRVIEPPRYWSAADQLRRSGMPYYTVVVPRESPVKMLGLVFKKGVVSDSLPHQMNFVPRLHA